jgi:hypothetical protein
MYQFPPEKLVVELGTFVLYPNTLKLTALVPPVTARLMFAPFVLGEKSENELPAAKVSVLPPPEA